MHRMYKMCKKSFLVFFLLLGLAQALEFNEVGHKSLGMGGVGVAVHKNPYALFYNPALGARSFSYRVGYGVSMEFNEKNLLKALDYDLSNISTLELREEINSLLANNFLRAKIQMAVGVQVPDIAGFGVASIGYLGSANLAGSFYGYIPDSITNIDDASAEFGLRRLDTLEVPISYAFTIDDEWAGTWSFGASLRLIQLKNNQIIRNIRSNDSKDSIQDDLKDMLKNNDSDSDFGVSVDAGFTYSPPLLEAMTFAIVAKNLNSPKFKFNNGKITLHPQARAGMSYDFDEYLTASADLDLNKNALLAPSIKGLPVQYSQKIGIGVEASGTYFSARAGASSDLRQSNGPIVSFGLGFGFLDFSASMATKRESVGGTRYPRYFSLQLGGGFTF